MTGSNGRGPWVSVLPNVRVWRVGRERHTRWLDCPLYVAYRELMGRDAAVEAVRGRVSQAIGLGDV